MHACRETRRDWKPFNLKWFWRKCYGLGARLNARSRGSYAILGSIYFYVFVGRLVGERRLDPSIYEALQKEGVTVGDVVYIEANSGAVKRVGRSDAYAAVSWIVTFRFVRFALCCRFFSLFHFILVRFYPKN